MKVSVATILLLLLLTCCCKQSYHCNCDTSEVFRNDSILKSKDAIEGLPLYYKRFNQKSLREQPNEAYRLMTMHSFNRYYQVFTLTKSKIGADFVIKEYFCKQSYLYSGKLVNEHHYKLNSAEWKRFKKTIERNCFWTLSVMDPDTSNYLDGGECNIEGFQPYGKNCSNSNYLITMRKSPGGSSKRFNNVYKAIMKMVDTTQIHETKW